MKLYTGIDLHSNNIFMGILSARRKRVFKKKLPNNPDIILHALKPYKKEIAGIVIESTYNWYWLVDLLMDEGYKVHLANTSAIKQYEGIKHKDDQDDAFWLAEMLRLNILETGCIYPKEERPIRDLLRKRGHLVRLRTSLILSLQNIISRNKGFKLSTNKIKLLKTDEVTPLLSSHEDLELSGKVSKDAIDFLTRQIRKIETVVQKKYSLRAPYQCLKTIPGIGDILSMTIMLETGPIKRFRAVGDYASYCRKVPTRWTSNDKTKAKGNKKNGNRYLAWAYSEAAEFASRHNEACKTYVNRKASRTNRMVARGALANKITRAAYYIMRDQVPFSQEKLFR